MTNRADAPLYFVAPEWGNGVVARWTCDLCLSESSNETDTPYTFRDEAFRKHVVCERCLDAIRSHSVAARLAEYADRLENHAAWLRQLTGAVWAVHRVPGVDADVDDPS